MDNFPDKYKPTETKKKKEKYLPQIVKEIRNYPITEIDYSTQSNVSYSQFSIYKQCPKRWGLRYRDKVKVFTDNINTVFGKALHEAIQRYLEVMYAESKAAADRLDNIDFFKERYREEYNQSYKKNNKQHFSNPDEMREYYEDGVEILNYFTRNAGKHFSKKGWYLVGCEVPVMQNPIPKVPRIVFQGHLDVVLYNEDDDKFKIIDIKTSTKGWSKWAKNDKNKTNQVLLYKKYFSDQFNVPLENIEVEYFIVRRKLPEENDFFLKRIQKFAPSHGKTSVKRANEDLKEFLKEGFAWNGYSDKIHEAKPDKWTCMFCAIGKQGLCKDKYEE